MTKANLWTVIVVLVIFCLGAFYLFGEWGSGKNQQVSNAGVENLFSCANEKTVLATFSNNPDAVFIKLIDGRSFTLPRAISGSGARYANSDESLVFWNKGNTAFVTENGVDVYTSCVLIAPDSGGLARYLTDSSGDFSVRYPADYTLNAAYKYDGLGPDKTIGGIKLTIASTTAEGTNLSSYDTGVSIEKISDVKNCSASLFLYPDERLKVSTTTDGNVTYSVASTTGVGLGNYYEETVFAVADTNPCVAVRYLVHSTNIQNYEPGAVKEFDRAALFSTLDKIRRSLVIGQ